MFRAGNSLEEIRNFTKYSSPHNSHSTSHLHSSLASPNTHLLTKIMEFDDSAEGPEIWCRKCVCGKRFYQPNSYTTHINNCTRYKKGVGSSLEGARARYKERKSLSKKGKAALNSWFGDDELSVDTALPGPSRHTNSLPEEETVSVTTC